jgi:hypothetical protein
MHYLNFEIQSTELTIDVHIYRVIKVQQQNATKIKITKMFTLLSCVHYCNTVYVNIVVMVAFDNQQQFLQN